MRRFRLDTFLVVLLVSAGAGVAQSAQQGALPDAPLAPMIAELHVAELSGTEMQKDGAAANGGQEQRRTLTRNAAVQMAIQNNPRVSVSRLLALAQHEVVRESRAAEMPTANVSVTAEDGEDGSRISAGSLTASRVFEHAGAGGSVTQLITDFGKTRNRILFSKLEEKAQNAHVAATQDDIAIATDLAFYNALEAQAVLRVAKQAVTTRQTIERQVSEMTKNNLKSTLDLSFADVNMAQAKLLLLDAENNTASTMAALDAVLGLDRQEVFDLLDDNSALQAPPPDADALVQLGLQQRLDLQALDLNHQAAVKFSKAQRDQMLPTLSAAGTVGSVPIRPAAYYPTNWWGGVGVNLDIPVFNGFLYSAQAKEAAIRAQVASEQTRELRDRIVRDIRTAWLAANTSYQRVQVTEELLKEADLALRLAQTRYKLGLSSIVELSQAEFQETDAAIRSANAQYEYRLSVATLNYQVGVNP